jgi:enoyl-CoA hydratase
MSVLVDCGDVWTVTLDRPASANALSAELVEALHDVLDEAELARPRALVLRGNDRHFSAGFDFSGLDAETDASLAHRFLRIGLLLERLVGAPYPTVAVADGVAIGGGADLVVHCDHRLVPPSVQLRFPGSTFGVALGHVRRRELGDALVTGQPDDLEDALRDVVSRPDHDWPEALADLAGSVGQPGLRDRLVAYASSTLTKEPA